jgi:hypothetical protein
MIVIVRSRARAENKCSARAISLIENEILGVESCHSLLEVFEERAK